MGLESHTPAAPPSLGSILRDQPVGRWVVIDADLTCILGAADTPEEALRLAGIASSSDDISEDDGERPVLMQVPDPTLAYVY